MKALMLMEMQGGAPLIDLFQYPISYVYGGDVGRIFGAYMIAGEEAVIDALADEDSAFLFTKLPEDNSEFNEQMPANTFGQMTAWIARRDPQSIVKIARRDGLRANFEAICRLGEPEFTFDSFSVADPGVVVTTGLPPVPTI